jgi:predicted nucleic acid-binding protein
MAIRVLLDTNIIIHREAGKAVHPDIGILFQWLDKLGYEKCIHPLTLKELGKNPNVDTVRTMQIKVSNYRELKTEAPLHEEVKKASQKLDTSDNDKEDTRLINEVFNDRVDFLITEDNKIHKKAEMLNISDRVYKINGFLEKVTAENPDLVDYKVLAVKKEYFGNINLWDSFFDSFREDYPGFDKWFNKKADEIAYVCYNQSNIVAFLYIKVEGEDENYSDIQPIFLRKKRLKIGTFKVVYNGFKLGERFLKIIFDNARQFNVAEIYVTIFDKRDEQKRLIELLQEWGFIHHGTKSSRSGEEQVYVRNFSRVANEECPKLTFPWLSKTSDVYIVPIYPEYHTELFPDSILRTESSLDYVENQPHRNAISKVYISRSVERNLKSGDIIIFYRTGGYYQSVATTIGIVENVKDNIQTEEEFFAMCKKRTVLTDDKLREFWNYRKTSRPFVVNFLYAYSFPRRPNMKELIELGIIADIHDAPRGFRKITREQFIELAKHAYRK